MKKIETLVEHDAGVYDTRKGNNRSEVQVPFEIVEKLASGVMTSEMVIELAKKFPIYRYITCITIHGDWPEVAVTRIGGYKNVLQNKNGSVAIRYSALDNAKRNRIGDALRLVKSKFYYSEFSTSNLFYQGKSVTRETYKEDIKKYQPILERIQSVPFWGDAGIYLYSGEWGNLELRLDLKISAILEENVLPMISALTGLSAEEFLKLEAEELEKERLKEEEREKQDKIREAESLRIQQLVEVKREELQKSLDKMPKCRDFSNLLVRVSSNMVGQVQYMFIRSKGKPKYGRINTEVAYSETLPSSPGHLKFKDSPKARKPEEIRGDFHKFVWGG